MLTLHIVFATVSDYLEADPGLIHASLDFWPKICFKLTLHSVILTFLMFEMRIQITPNIFVCLVQISSKQAHMLSFQSL